MRAQFAIAISVVVLGFGTAMIVYALPAAEADQITRENSGVDVAQLHQTIRHVPVQVFSDLSFIYAEDERSN